MIDKKDKEEKQIRVAIYVRVSTEDQVEKFGLDMQKNSIFSFLKSKGQLEDGRDAMVLAGTGDEHIYVDDGISGTKQINERRDFWRLQENIELNSPGSRPFDAVAVYKVDRLARKLTILLDIIDLFDKHDISLISVNESIDTSTPFGRAILGIMGVIAELEIETTKERTKGGKLAAILKGKYQGQAPYGYLKNKDGYLYEFTEESKHVKEIFNWCVFEDKNTREIADLLSNKKIVSPEISAINNQKRKGKSRKLNNDFFWRNETVKYILSNETYIGNYWYAKTSKRKEIKKEDWLLSDYKLPRIIENSVFNTAQNKLKDSANKVLLSRKRDDDNLYLLSGLIKCGWCQKHSNTRIAHTWNGNKKEITKGSGEYSLYYKCGHKDTSKYDTTCPTIPVPAEQLESYVISFIKNLLSNPKAAFEHQQKLKSNQLQIQHLNEERDEIVLLINKIPIRKENLSLQHENNIISNEELLERSAKIDKERKELNIRLKEINSVLGQQVMSDGYVKSFEEYSKKYLKALDEVTNNKEEIYTIIHNLIEKIIIDSRLYNPTIDKIAGRKKENQQIPNSITIKLKLPKELLNELVTQEIKNVTNFWERTDTR
jgi:site-specific DNA recombinase